MNLFAGLAFCCHKCVMFRSWQAPLFWGKLPNCWRHCCFKASTNVQPPLTDMFAWILERWGRNFFLFTVANFFANSLFWDILFSFCYKSFHSTWDTRHFDTEGSQVGHTRCALGKSMLSTADCSLVFHMLRCGWQEDMVCGLSRESFHSVLFSLYFILTRAAIIVYPLQYLRCCIAFICSNDSKQTHHLQSDSTQSPA